jgi:hypothetical protein
MSLLEKTQKIMEVEKSLTGTLEKVEPWLPGAQVHHFPNRPRVRPVPTNMEQVHHILAVARSLANRTSAPAGWSPSAPVVGFSTPNPLPHQLRGGALAALQLERAVTAEREKKRQRLQQQQVQQEAAAKEEPMEVEEKESVESDAGTDPKRREVKVYEHLLDRSKSSINKQDATVRRPPLEKRPEYVSMNLSESSSSEEEED